MNIKSKYSTYQTKMDGYTLPILVSVVFYKLLLTNVREIEGKEFTENSPIRFLVPRI